MGSEDELSIADLAAQKRALILPPRKLEEALKPLIDELHLARGDPEHSNIVQALEILQQHCLVTLMMPTRVVGQLHNFQNDMDTLVDPGWRTLNVCMGYSEMFADAVYESFYKLATTPPPPVAEEEEEVAEAPRTPPPEEVFTMESFMRDVGFSVRTIVNQTQAAAELHSVSADYLEDVVATINSLHAGKGTMIAEMCHTQASPPKLRYAARGTLKRYTTCCLAVLNEVTDDIHRSIVQQELSPDFRAIRVLSTAELYRTGQRSSNAVNLTTLFAPFTFDGAYFAAHPRFLLVVFTLLVETYQDVLDPDYEVVRLAEFLLRCVGRFPGLDIDYPIGPEDLPAPTQEPTLRFGRVRWQFLRAVARTPIDEFNHAVDEYLTDVYEERAESLDLEGEDAATDLQDTQAAWSTPVFRSLETITKHIRELRLEMAHVLVLNPKFMRRPALLQWVSEAYRVTSENYVYPTPLTPSETSLMRDIVAQGQFMQLFTYAGYGAGPSSSSFTEHTQWYRQMLDRMGVQSDYLLDDSAPNIPISSIESESIIRFCRTYSRILDPTAFVSPNLAVLRAWADYSVSFQEMQQTGVDSAMEEINNQIGDCLQMMQFSCPRKEVRTRQCQLLFSQFFRRSGGRLQKVLDVATRGEVFNLRALVELFNLLGPDNNQLEEVLSVMFRVHADRQRTAVLSMLQASMNDATMTDIANETVVEEEWEPVNAEVQLMSTLPSSDRTTFNLAYALAYTALKSLPTMYRKDFYCVRKLLAGIATSVSSLCTEMIALRAAQEERVHPEDIHAPLELWLTHLSDDSHARRELLATAIAPVIKQQNEGKAPDRLQTVPKFNESLRYYSDPEPIFILLVIGAPSLLPYEKRQHVFGFSAVAVEEHVTRYGMSAEGLHDKYFAEYAPLPGTTTIFQLAHSNGARELDLMTVRGVIDHFQTNVPDDPKEFERNLEEFKQLLARCGPHRVHVEICKYPRTYDHAADIAVAELLMPGGEALNENTTFFFNPDEIEFHPIPVGVGANSIAYCADRVSLSRLTTLMNRIASLRGPVHSANPMEYTVSLAMEVMRKVCLGASYDDFPGTVNPKDAFVGCFFQQQAEDISYAENVSGRSVVILENFLPNSIKGLPRTLPADDLPLFVCILLNDRANRLINDVVVAAVVGNGDPVQGQWDTELPERPPYLLSTTCTYSHTYLTEAVNPYF